MGTRWRSRATDSSEVLSSVASRLRGPCYISTRRLCSCNLVAALSNSSPHDADAAPLLVSGCWLLATLPTVTNTCLLFLLGSK